LSDEAIEPFDEAVAGAVACAASFAAAITAGGFATGASFAAPAAAAVADESAFGGVSDCCSARSDAFDRATRWT
jgi:hypothetical protein